MIWQCFNSIFLSWGCVIFFCTPTLETTSDQSDIESRIRALKDELRKRKSVVYQLKKEQKKRQKERLKAQEASLLKQLEVSGQLLLYSLISVEHYAVSFK